MPELASRTALLASTNTGPNGDTFQGLYHQPADTFGGRRLKRLGADNDNDAAIAANTAAIAALTPEPAGIYTYRGAVLGWEIDPVWTGPYLNENALEIAEPAASGTYTFAIVAGVQWLNTGVAWINVATVISTRTVFPADNTAFGATIYYESAAAETDPVYLADKPAIALKSELHDGAVQDTAIAALTAALPVVLTGTFPTQANHNHPYADDPTESGYLVFANGTSAEISPRDNQYGADYFYDATWSYNPVPQFIFANIGVGLQGRTYKIVVDLPVGVPQSPPVTGPTLTVLGENFAVNFDPGAMEALYVAEPGADGPTPVPQEVVDAANAELAKTDWGAYVGGPAAAPEIYFRLFSTPATTANWSMNTPNIAIPVLIAKAWAFKG